MQINKLLKYSRKSKSASGFTLTELLISSFIGVLVIGATGYGLTNLLRGNKTATAQTNKRTEINRAMEFISDEIKRADTIDVDPATAFAAVPNPPSGAQPVLALKIPGVKNAGVVSPIIYFVSSPRDADTSVWKGPKVIYRFGPPLGTAGEYTNGAWALEPLVDGISEDTATVTCDDDETASPSNGALGFYACILPTTDDPAKGETAKIFAIGKLDDSNEYSENYQADTQVFARAEEEDLDGKDPDLKFNAACNFVSGALTCPGGGNKKYTLDSLANAFACEPGGERWKVKITAYYISDPATIPPTETVLGQVDSGSSTSLEFTSAQTPLFRVEPDKENSPAACKTPSAFKPFTEGGSQNHDPVSSSNTANFKQLEDGDSIDEALNKSYEVQPGGASQQSARTEFESRNLIDTLDPTKINIDAGRYIIAFEMGQVDTAQPGFDTQDQILSIIVQE